MGVMPDRQDRKETEVETTALEGKALNPKARKAFDKFVEAKQAEANAKKAKAEAEAELRAYMGEETVARVGKVIAFTIVASHNTHFDAKVLETNFPEAFEASQRRTDYDYIKVLLKQA